MPVEADLPVLGEASVLIEGLAAYVATLRERLIPDVGQARSQLVMCEQDLLSALDAWEKATAGLDETDFTPGTTIGRPPTPFRPAVTPTARRPRAFRNVCDGQQQLFPTAAD